MPCCLRVCFLALIVLSARVVVPAKFLGSAASIPRQLQVPLLFSFFNTTIFLLSSRRSSFLFLLRDRSLLSAASFCNTYAGARGNPSGLSMAFEATSRGRRTARDFCNHTGYGFGWLRRNGSIKASVGTAISLSAAGPFGVPWIQPTRCISTPESRIPVASGVVFLDMPSRPKRRAAFNTMSTRRPLVQTKQPKFGFESPLRDRTGSSMANGITPGATTTHHDQARTGYAVLLLTTLKEI
ncbi:hypothetical protein BU23DRAFT_573934 [Bimuria novae-zelandiae CBS 107.79]|uniref:Secreted protein n=1 Tax=Bimuria novae-zelandiae CBS 107.79 TaxID=1447943 RepID=A0A6A5US07_9PLEO|nr:hypothetical protein BU23DRAFT_573934 [Bimuria novae-zelandiae CBS 107.79]